MLVKSSESFSLNAVERIAPKTKPHISFQRNEVSDGSEHVSLAWHQGTGSHVPRKSPNQVLATYMTDAAQGR